MKKGCKHDWYVYGDIAVSEHGTLFFPHRRECKSCGKIGNTSDADYSKIDQKLLSMKP